MPSARIHEAIARKINVDNKYDDLLLRLGTVAPDSWRNVENGVKNKYITHFWDFNIKEGQANNYDEFYLKYYNDLENPFYFGYLIHLIVDQYWKTYIDPKYHVSKNCVKLLDGTLKEDVDWYSYHEDVKIQKQLCKHYNLTSFPLYENEIPNFYCNIDEIDLSGLFGENGTLKYINTKLMPDNIENSKLYTLKNHIDHINETTNFVKRELERLKQLKIEDDNRIKITVDIDDTILSTKELEEYYWNIFLNDNPKIDPNQEYSWGNPILSRFWSEYREKIAFGKVKDGVSDSLNELIEKGYRIDLLTARPLDKYAKLKEKLVDYFSNNNISYNYMFLGFHSKKEFLKEHNYNILIDNDMKYIKEAESVGVIPILYGNNPLYNGYQTDNWNEIPKIISEIIKKR